MQLSLARCTSFFGSTRVLTCQLLKVLVWDIASGTEVQGWDYFAFDAGANLTPLKTHKHTLTVHTSHKYDPETLVISGRSEHGRVRDATVACFKAPQPITSFRFHGTTICLGCSGGAVCVLQAPFLAA